MTSDGQFIAKGLYNPTSTIRVRLYRWDDGPLDDAFWAESLAKAVRLRTDTLGLGRDPSAYRLIFSEGDGLSGLTVDRYDRWLVAQFTSLAALHPTGADSRAAHCAHRCRGDHHPNRPRRRTEGGLAVR